MNGHKFTRQDFEALSASKLRLYREDQVAAGKEWTPMRTLSAIRSKTSELRLLLTLPEVRSRDIPNRPTRRAAVIQAV